MKPPTDPCKLNKYHVLLTRKDFDSIVKVLNLGEKQLVELVKEGVSRKVIQRAIEKFKNSPII